MRIENQKVVKVKLHIVSKLESKPKIACLLLSVNLKVLKEINAKSLSYKQYKQCFRLLPILLFLASVTVTEAILQVCIKYQYQKGMPSDTEIV